jgi:hypothetical protein
MNTHTCIHAYAYVSSSRPSYLEYEILQDAAFLFLAQYAEVLSRWVSMFSLNTKNGVNNSTEGHRSRNNN